MSDTTSSEAVNDAPLSMAEAISQFSDGDTTSSPAPADQGTAEEDEEDGETQGDGQNDDQADDEGATDEDPVDDEASDEAGEDDDDEREISGGRFAADDAKVRLEDGTYVSVAELKRNNLYQRDYTQKTQALAEERKTLDASRSQVQQLEREIAQQRQLVQTFAQRLMPQAPSREMMDTDPLGYMQAKADYDDQVARINQLGAYQQQEEARREAETAEQTRTRRLEEAQKLQALMPELADPERYKQFFTNTVQVMSKYGYSSDEVSAAEDHRMYPIFKALQRLERIDAAKGKVEKKVEGKPPVMRGGKRPNQAEQAAQARQAAFDRLNRTGRLQDAIDLVPD